VSDKKEYTEIALYGVSKQFGLRKESRVLAVDDVSLTVTSEMRLGIVGESGSGKSTVSRLMVGLENRSAGTSAFNGEDIQSLYRGRMRDFRRAVQFVAQDTSSSFDPRKTLRAAVQAPLIRLRGMRPREADLKVAEVLEMLSLAPELANRRPNQVSGGQRQRFALARALVVEPRILICDEVVSALDVSVQGTILNLLRQYCEEHSMGLVFVSHGLPATSFVAEELVVMHRGRIVEKGSVDEVVDHPAHPYARDLLDAHHSRPEHHASLRFAAPERADWACRFAAYCDRATDICATERPRTVDDLMVRRSVACHHPVTPGVPSATEPPTETPRMELAS
jgi:peptide/nickel transport system ATP-binding protein